MKFLTDWDGSCAMTEVMMPKQARETEIMPVMVGTAGHVDHGKTSLVRLLTGCDTDRLPEEKKRGMSIDLGFAPCQLAGSRMVGIIDVPGHEDFIKNMVAGASSIDVLMLVIAADDGIMPQTVEHLKVVSLLRTPRVMVAITKIDLVPETRREEVRREVTDFLQGCGFENAPVIFVSNKTGDGVSEVRDAMDQLVSEVRGAEQESSFRMPVERVFTVQGYGAVAAGIPVSGRCKVGDTLELLPGRKLAVVRAIQRYKRDSRETAAHMCSAINLRNLKSEEIERGMTLSTPGAYRETSLAILSVKNVHESKVIKRRTQMHFHYGTSQRNVAGLLVGCDELRPGEEGFMRIRCERPMTLAAGDRFILRSLSPATTVAGGIVLTIRSDERRKKDPHEVERFEMAKAAAESNDFFKSELLAGPSAVISKEDMPVLLQRSPAQIDPAVKEQEQLGMIAALGPSHWLISSRRRELGERLVQVLGRYHKKSKYSRGMPAEEVCEALGLEKSCFEGLKKIFEGCDRVAIYPNCISLSDFKPVLSAPQQNLREQILAKVIASGRAGIARGELQLQLGAKDSDTQLLLRLLSEEGMIVVADYYLIHPAVVKGCFEKFVELSRTDEIVELGVFRDALGLKRNLAVAVLDLFDSKGMTRREGKGRRLLNANIRSLIKD